MELEDKGLEEILNASDPGDEADPIVEPKSDIHEESPLLDDRPRDEKGRFAPKETTGEEAKEPVAAPPAESAHVPVMALQDERRKRQEAERELAYYRQAQQMAQRQPEQAPDFWEDPAGTITSEVQRAVAVALQQAEAERLQAQADRAEAAARAKYPDYDDAFAKFREQVQINPALAQELRYASDPAEFAYQRGKQAIEISQVGSLEDYKARIEAEVRAKVEAELAQNALRPSLPITTAGQRSVGERGGPAWGGPPDLKSILR